MGSDRPVFQILVAEDNLTDIRPVREALAEQCLDGTLHVVNDGEQAISYIERLDRDSKGPILDLLLLDMHLPKWSGAKVLQWLRATERHEQTPAIVMTGVDSPHHHEAAEKNAALHYFRKTSTPAGFMQLGAVVSSILSNKTRDAQVASQATTGGGEA